ncbi:hypothetical protein [Clostridium estertheticum]|uniref:Uncharacterized protein n=1 Tax=Clostridium estertheticum subsp. estertheticum TaxID=1552 RepID=A0A1J0GI36_9CLOT|nr:hypothetical protein [Clostridium estertheticum]APC40624.1 hypothetical protein A7L45_11355 [Clostridium estertheticum subsp. estertheticum]MBU3074408.1 hypothetical protein [Clostridium estertheticum]MBU3164502.1 hypothetical protein [Clostridium estertheticum]MBU3170847.1 hypothetical protein [Clostridium estertheticum]MBU3184510.1 hypothetical protein [Clostridium estertheticum]
MFFNSKKTKAKKENEARLKRINNFEVRYVTTRDPNQYGESIIGKGCVINILNNQFIIQSDSNVIFTHSIESLQCSELMSQNGIILSYTDDKTGEYVEVIAYYKYHRK